jgi:succinate dehydrogenase hydrophobic anchor subunit
MRAAREEVMVLWRWLEDGPERSRHGPIVLGNLRLTAITGLVLVLLLALVYGTGAFFGDLRAAHFFTGFLIVPPILIKLSSTGWRFVNYYAGSVRYRAAGPPWLLPRILGALLVPTTIVAIASGVILWIQGTQRGPWSTIHTDSIIVLLCLAGVHLVVHGRRALSAVEADLENRAYFRRWLVAGLSVVAGVALAAAMALVEPTWHGDSRQRSTETQKCSEGSGRTPIVSFAIPMSACAFTGITPVVRTCQGTCLRLFA